jgi:hypothetical protein
MSQWSLINAVLLTIDSAGQSGYVLSSPEVEHEEECPLCEEEDEEEEEEEGEEEDDGEEESFAPADPPPRTPSCSCRVLGYEINEAGLVTTQPQRESVCDGAVDLAVDLGVPLIVIREHWTRHGLSNASFESLLINWGKWEAALEMAGALPDMVVKALPDTWRRPLFGPLKGLKRPQLKQKAHLYVTQVMKLPPYSEDICEALCIREWGSRADEVHTLLKRTA